MVFAPGLILSESFCLKGLLCSSKWFLAKSITYGEELAKKVRARGLWNEMRLPYTNCEILLSDVFVFWCAWNFLT